MYYLVTAYVYKFKFIYHLSLCNVNLVKELYPKQNSQELIPERW